LKVKSYARTVHVDSIGKLYTVIRLLMGRNRPRSRFFILNSMNRKDIPTIRKILKKEGRDYLADLLDGAYGEVDESSSFGSYYNSFLSQYLFFLELDKYHQAQKIKEDDKEALLNAVLYLYPHQDESPEIFQINFRLNREMENDVLRSDISGEINHEFTKEQIEKCRYKIEREDFDGAISSSGSLLEAVFNDIYEKCTSKKLKDTSDLRDAYKRVKSLIKLSDEQYSSESIKNLMRGLSSIVASLDSLRNQMGDRHIRLTKPWKRHAKLCVNSAVVLTDYLYETLDFQKNKIHDTYEKLVAILDSNKRFLDKDEIASDQKLLEHFNEYDEYLKNEVKNIFINDFKIRKYRESDIFFAAMRALFNQLSKNDIDKIYNKNIKNDQACGLPSFLSLALKERPEIVTRKDILGYIKDQKNEIEEINEGKTIEPF